MSQLIDRLQQYDLAGYQYASFNQNYGFRYYELTDITRWSIVGHFNVIVNTEKGSADRILNISEVPTFIVNSIPTQTPIFQNFRYSTACRIILRCLPIRPILIGDKQVITHLFRYYIAKKMKDQGSTDNEIATFLGEIDPNNAKIYIYGDLTTP